MPANPKYLTKSSWQQFAKLSAGILGGYLISALFHMVLSLWLPAHHEILILGIYTIYILWITLMIVPFLFKNGWKVWGIYLVSLIVLFGLYYLGNQQNPFV